MKELVVFGLDVFGSQALRPSTGRKHAPVQIEFFRRLEERVVLSSSFGVLLDLQSSTSTVGSGRRARCRRLQGVQGFFLLCKALQEIAACGRSRLPFHRGWFKPNEISMPPCLFTFCFFLFSSPILLLYFTLVWIFFNSVHRL